MWYIYHETLRSVGYAKLLLFHLTELMSRNCFEAILTALSYVDHDLPVLLDHFWKV